MSNKSKVRLVNKISPKTLKTSPKMILVNVDGKDVPRCDGDQMLYRIIGRAISFKTGNTEFGEWTSFGGDFRATIIATGEEIRSSVAFFPDMVTGALRAAVESSDAGVDMAFDIGAIAASTPTGYQYTVNQLIAPNPETDPLKALLESVEPLPVLKIALDVETVTEDGKTVKTSKKK